MSKTIGFLVLVCGAVLAQEPPAADATAEARGHLDRAEALLKQEKPGEACEELEKARALLAGVGDAEAALGLDPRIAACHVAEGHPEKAVEAWRRGGDRVDAVEGLVGLGSQLISMGRQAEAIPLLMESLEMRRRMGDPECDEMAEVLNAIGHCLEAAGRPREALPYYRESLEMRRRLHPGDHPDVARILNNYAYCLASVDRAAEALPLHEEAVGMSRRLSGDETQSIAVFLNNLAICLTHLDRPQEALAPYKESLAIRRRLSPGDDAGVARCMNNLAACLRSLNCPEDALPLFQESLEMRRRLFPQDHPDVAQSIDNIAGCLVSLGRLTDGLRMAEEALAMRRRVFPRDHPEVAGSLRNVACCLWDVGRAAEALALYEDSLRMYARLFPGDSSIVAACLGDVALCMKTLGRATEALPLYQESLAMYRRIFDGDRAAVATALNNLARCLDALARSDDALPLYRESLEMKRHLYKGDDTLLADGLNNLALCLDKLGRTSEALPLYEESLAMRRHLFAGDHPAVAQGLGNVGFCLCDLGRVEEGLPLLEEAVAMSRRLGSRDTHEWLSNQGACLFRAGRAAEAADALREAVDRIEDLRSEASGLLDDDLATYYGTLKEFHAYARLIQVLRALEKDGEALTYLERARSRGLLDTLERGRLDALAEVHQRAEERQDAELMERVRAAQASIEAADAEVARLTHALARTGTATERREEARKLTAELASARRARHEALRERAQLIRAELAVAQPADAAAVQQLAMPDGLVLEYSVAPEGAMLFFVPPPGSAIRTFVLAWPDGSRVTAANLTAKVEAYAASMQRDGGAGRGVRVEGASTGAAPAPEAKELFEALVPADVRESVLKAKLVYVVPDGALNRLPFETLVVKPGTFWLEGGPPLVYGASGSALLWSRQRRNEQLAGTRLAEAVVVADPLFRPAVEPPAEGILVIRVQPDGQAARRGVQPGDVILAYDGRDVPDAGTLREAAKAALDGGKGGEIVLSVWRSGERRDLKVETGPLGIEISLEPAPEAWTRFQLGDPALARQSLERTAELSRFGGLNALPGTRREADAIAAALKDLKVTRLLGENATHPAVLEAAPRARYLHFATHGLADETESSSYSSLALTLPATPTAEDNGFLALKDLFATWRGKLRMCELVVLSACETQKGYLQKDEAVQALPVGFLYAGAPTVIATLWRVDDASTAELMGDFYGRIAAGKGTLEAFTAARKALRKKHPEPYHWAPFVYIGDPR